MANHASLLIKHMHNILIPNAWYLGIWYGTVMQQKIHDPKEFPISWVSINLYIYIYIYISISIWVFQKYIMAYEFVSKIAAT